MSDKFQKIDDTELMEEASRRIRHHGHKRSQLTRDLASAERWIDKLHTYIAERELVDDFDAFLGTQRRLNE